MIKIKRPMAKRMFIRARSKETGKFEYVGNIPHGWMWHYIHATSWLLRFGGYDLVRYYNSKTKQLIREFDLESHEKYCRENRWNDFVWRDTDYFVKSKKLLDKEAA